MTTAAFRRDDVRVIPEMELCDRLGRSLRMIGSSSQEIAELMGVTPTTVSRWLNGRTKPSRAVLMIWSDMTGVDLHWLETGEGWAPRGSNPEPAVSQHSAWGVNSRLTANRPAVRHLRAVS